MTDRSVSSSLPRLSAGFLVGLGGLLQLPIVPPQTLAGWLGWVGVGVLVGAIVRRVRDVWLAPLVVIAFLGIAAGSSLIDPGRPFWIVGAAIGAVAHTIGFLVGTGLRWQRGHGASIAGTLGRWRRPAIGLLILVLLVPVGLGAYGFVVGADEFLAPVSGRHGCATPATRFGWTYEAINYDPADDPRLVAAEPDLDACDSQGSPAGGDVLARDGVPIAGWYIPSERGSGPTGPTVLIVHGGRANKSAMLDYAPPFHRDYNLVLLDLRNSGRSGAAASTAGLHERWDVRAMLDWLERTKAPSWIAVMGNSNGAATAVAEAGDDPRVRALILDSMHARVETQIGNIAETERSLPAWPGAWALVVGVSLRLGEDLAAVDPVASIGRLATRPVPVLLTHGLQDVVDRPADSLEVNLAAAIAARLPVEVGTCPGAGHGEVVLACQDEWAAWVRSFLATHAPTIGP